MKTPFGEKSIKDYFVGVFPPDELDSMERISKIRSAELLGEGDDVSWELLFQMKIVAILEAYDKEIANEMSNL